MPEPAKVPRFRSLFDRWSRRVRARLALRHVLGGAAVGLVIGAAGSAAAWQSRHGALRPLGALGGVLGGVAGYAMARRRRWHDADVALYLDAKLDSNEAIATAVELASSGSSNEREGEDEARAVVISQAAIALEGASPKKVRAPVLRSWHLALPIGAAAIAWVSVAPLPPAPPAPAKAPGADVVKLADIEGLEKIIKLAELNARDDAQRERLKKLSEDAKKLRDKLKKGVEKREAQADLAKLRDGISAEKLSIGEGVERQGMESALGKLGENPDLKGAEKALGDRDLTSLDDEMERLANKLEKTDRDRALKTLEEAAEAAKKNGAPNVAKTLEEQKKRLAERGKKLDKLKELAKELGDGLGPEGKEALKDMEKGGGGKEQQKLAEGLDKALGKLTPEERKRLAENLKKKMAQAPEEGMPGKGPSKQQLKDLAEQLETEEGQKQLEEELRKMAKEPPPGSEEGDRQRGLDDAQKGAGEAEGQMGAPMPLPMAGDKPGQGNKGPSGNQGKDGKGNPSPGHSEDPPGKADHKGVTGVIDGDGVRARANAKLGKGKPMPGITQGRAAGRPGDTANLKGEGGIGAAAPDEVGGIERSDVPEEYREQVGRYFKPR